MKRNFIVIVKKRYHELCKLLHPDRATGDSEKFKELKTAYKILSDPLKRAKYDSAGIIDESPNIYIVSDQTLEACRKNYAGKCRAGQFYLVLHRFTVHEMDSSFDCNTLLNNLVFW